ncbi:hypothetical protein B0H63DRAFT_453873 [Podospora didyma]|uniref:NADH-ubiquinone oxidoreductase 17.8 kDa subunit n=1 Tax=Podospora didyma TaxID=330526 RepID=A0AAE0N6Z8_9PEZI|nr:hypothetical protein B0H63DRAFT_453873 [Podospora didyma]
MSALGQRAASVARQARPTVARNTRSYASGGHDHHHAPAAPEALGKAFFVAVGAIPASMVLYAMSRPGKDGEKSTFGKYLEDVSNMRETWKTRNHLTTAAVEQAARDKHLFYNVERSAYHELRHPEVFQHGSPFNVPAGHSVNMDKVVAHYQRKHLDEEDRKARKLAAAA